MKDVLQYRVIGPSNYWQRYARYTKLMLKEMIEVTVKCKDAVSSKITICEVSCCYSFVKLVAVIVL